MSRAKALAGVIAAGLFEHDLRVRATAAHAQAYCSCGWHGPTRSWWRSRTDRDSWRHALDVVEAES